MSNWITDRRPTEADADYEKCVWTMCVGKVVLWRYKEISDGWPWMRTNRPKPYAKPKRWEVDHSGGELWGIFDKLMGRYAYPMLPTREAAERIAAIYEEVMP